MKKKIYLVYVEQSFNAIGNAPKEKWYERSRKRQRRVVVDNKRYERLILATSLNEAVEIYKRRYRTEFDYVIDSFWNWDSCEWLDEKNPDFQHIVKGYETMYIFDTLKKKMWADEFLEYCKQELLSADIVSNQMKE